MRHTSTGYELGEWVERHVIMFTMEKVLVDERYEDTVCLRNNDNAAEKYKCMLEAGNSQNQEARAPALQFRAHVRGQ